MKFIEMYEKIQKENEGYITLLRNGIFFTAIGASAIEIAGIFNFKLICMKEEYCKCGLPINSIEKYIKKLQELNKAFVIYDYLKDELLVEDQYKEIVTVDGKKMLENRQHLDCKECWCRNNMLTKKLDNCLELIEKLQKELNKNG